MATDDFNNTNGTALFTHNSDWAHADSQVDEAEIQSNGCQPAGDWDLCAHRNTTSTEDTSEAVFVGHAGTLREARSVNIRMSATVEGYAVALTNISGSNYTGISIYREGVWQASTTSLSIDGTVNQTVKITAEVSGPNLVIRGYINGTEEVNWTDTAPLSSGNSGFVLEGGGAGTLEAVRIDDWSDVAAVEAIVGNKIRIIQNRTVTN